MNNQLFLNPFSKIAGLNSFMLGFLSVLLAGFLSLFSGTYFDGILNAHVVSDGSLIKHLLWPFLSVATVAVWFLIWGIILSKSKVRGIDIAGTQFFAFTPMLPVSLLGFSPSLNGLTQLLSDVTPENIQRLDIPANIIINASVIMFFTLMFTVWSAIWMYNGFKVSTNLPHKKTVPVYVSGIIIGMILPRVIMSWIF